MNTNLKLLFLSAWKIFEKYSNHGSDKKKMFWLELVFLPKAA